VRSVRARAAWGVIAAAAVLLAAIWRLLPAASPPLYDGVCIADPYRSVGSSPAPSSASQTYAAGQFPAAEVTTNETPAQAQVLMMSGSFSSPNAPVTVSVTPVSSPARAPSGLRLESNVYRISATAAGQTLQPSSSLTVVLRGSGGSASLTMYVDSGGGWQQLRTFNVGCGYAFEAVSQKLGYFALFASSSGGGSGGGGSGGGFPAIAIVGVLAAVVVVATIALARFSAGRRR
jgi:hypothetical protein